MANNLGCGNRRNSNNAYGCLNCLGGRRCWDNFPYYGGPCPDAEGIYACDREEENDRERGCRRRGQRYRDSDFCIFSAMLPMAVAANGIIPLVNNNCLGAVEGFPVNSGLVTIEQPGTYLATYTVRVPEGQTVDSTLTLNVNDASQSSAVSQIGGEGPAGFTAQAIIDVGENATLALRSSEAINLTETSAQPLVTLSLVRI